MYFVFSDLFISFFILLLFYREIMFLSLLTSILYVTILDIEIKYQRFPLLKLSLMDQKVKR